MGTARCSRAQQGRLSAGQPEGQAKRSQTRMPGGVGGAGSIPVPTRLGPVVGWHFNRSERLPVTEEYHVGSGWGEIDHSL